HPRRLLLALAGEQRDGVAVGEEGEGRQHHQQQQGDREQDQHLAPQPQPPRRGLHESCAYAAYARTSGSPAKRAIRPPRARKTPNGSLALKSSPRTPISVRPTAAPERAPKKSATSTPF